MASKILNLIAITSLAVIATSFGATPVTALSTGHQHLSRQMHSHEVIAQKKRANTSTQRCRPRSSSTAAPAPLSSALSGVAPSPTPTKASSAPAQPPAASPSPSKAASSSAAPAPSSAPASTGGSGNQGLVPGRGKVCLAWANGDDPSLPNFITDAVGLIYTWSPERPSNIHGLEHMPMLWGFNQVSDFDKVVQPGYAKYILGMNEPNQSGQSDMSPQDAANLWMQHIQPKKAQGYTLISPATTSAPSGKTWMQQFLAACKGCTIDMMALHWYDVSAEAFKAYLEDWHNTFGRPLLITEYADQNFNGGAQASQDEVFAFFSEVNAWMDQQDYVKAYCPFGFMHDMQGVNTANQLMTGAGQPTDLGWMVLNNKYT